jgi:hypothetical protein
MWPFSRKSKPITQHASSRTYTVLLAGQGQFAVKSEFDLVEIWHRALADKSPDTLFPCEEEAEIEIGVRTDQIVMIALGFAEQEAPKKNGRAQ